MDLLLLISALAALGIIAVLVRHRSKQRELSHREQALTPVRKLAFEDVTAFGVDLANLDAEISGHELDEGATGLLHERVTVSFRPPGSRLAS